MMIDKNASTPSLASRRCRLALLAAAVTLLAGAGTAGAQNASPPPPNPKGWHTVETLGFRMALPAGYKEFLTDKPDPDKNPHYGTWGFMSPHATRKVYVSISRIRRGTAVELLKKAEPRLAAKLGELSKLEYIPIEKDELGRDGAIGFYKGVMHAISRKTGELAEYHHLAKRGILRYPKWRLQVTITHIVRGDRLEAADAFFLQQIETFVARDPREARKLAAKLRAQAQ